MDSVRTIGVAGGGWGRQCPTGWRLGAPMARVFHLIGLGRLGLGLCLFSAGSNKDFIFGYPRVTRGWEAIPVPIPAKPRVGYGYYLRVKFYAHARTCRVGYLRIPVPVGKIAIPTKKSSDLSKETETTLLRLRVVLIKLVVIFAPQ
jgi:hypothetical protein